jgi:transposase-like protein
MFRMWCCLALVVFSILAGVVAPDAWTDNSVRMGLSIVVGRSPGVPGPLADGPAAWWPVQWRTTPAGIRAQARQRPRPYRYGQAKRRRGPAQRARCGRRGPRRQRRAQRQRATLVAWCQLQPVLSTGPTRQTLIQEARVTEETTATREGSAAGFLLPIQIVVVNPDYSQTMCQLCGGPTKCKRSYYSHPQDINLEQPTILQVYREVRECLDPACGERWAPELDFVDQSGRFTKRAKQKAIAAVVEDGVPGSRVPQRMWRDFHVRVAKSTVHEWVHAEAEADLGAAEYTQWVVARFSGVVGIDEVHVRDEHGHKQYLVVAVDPINDRTLLFDLLDSNDSDALQGFLEQLEQLGIDPLVVITDMWDAYRVALAEVFPEAAHQLCVFHVIKNVMKHTNQALLAYRRGLPKKTKTQQAIRRELWDFRYSLLRANPRLTEKQRDRVADLLHFHQGTVLAEAYCCKEAILALFRESRTQEGARVRRDMIVQRFGAVPELAKVLNLIRGADFEQMIIYLDYENLDKTNNDAERTNRVYQKGEKVRYQARTTRTRLNYVKLQARQRNQRSTHRQERLRPKKKRGAVIAGRIDAVADQEARRLAM